jgi:hypothetical protein
MCAAVCIMALSGCWLAETLGVLLVICLVDARGFVWRHVFNHMLMCNREHWCADVREGW